MGRFKFESIDKADKRSADVTIYENGMVRFSRQAIETYGICETQILWGEDKENNTLAFRKVSQGRALRGKRMDTTSCQMQIAKRYAGKYSVKVEGEVFVLSRADAPTP